LVVHAADDDAAELLVTDVHAPAGDGFGLGRLLDARASGDAKLWMQLHDVSVSGFGDGYVLTAEHEARLTLIATGATFSGRAGVARTGMRLLARDDAALAADLGTGVALAGAGGTCLHANALGHGRLDLRASSVSVSD